MELLKLDLIVRALDDKKAEDIVTIEVGDKTPFFDYYVIATVNNSRQASSCVDAIEENFEKSSLSIKKVDGRYNSSWTIVDCEDILVHTFTPEERNRISLEKLLESIK